MASPQFYRDNYTVRTEDHGENLATYEVSVYVPAYMQSDRIEVVGNNTSWAPRVALSFVRNHPVYGILLGRAAVFLNCCDLLQENGELCFNTMRKHSTVLKWVELIRKNAHKFDCGELRQPSNMALEEGTAMAGDHLDSLMTSTGHKMKGCKVSLITFNRHVRRAKKVFDAMHLRARLFPMQNSAAVREAVLDAYKLARFTQSSGHDWSEAHLRFACFLNAVAPQVVPHAQGNNQAQTNQIANFVHQKFVQYECGFQWKNALKFAGLCLKRAECADAEVEHGRAEKRHKRVA